MFFFPAILELGIYIVQDWQRMQHLKRCITCFEVKTPSYTSLAIEYDPFVKGFSF